jgi:predicted metal-dependent hydrolase
MTHLQLLEAKTKEVIEALRGAVARAVAPLRDRLESVERSVAAMPKPEDIAAVVREELQALPPAKDGRDADAGAIAADVLETVRRELEEMPRPRDGRDYDPEVLRETVQAAVAALPPARDGKDGRDGKDVDTVALAEMLAVAASRACEAMPRPRDGKDVDPAALEVLIKTHVDLAVASRPAAVDPVELAGQIAAAAMLAATRACEALPRPADGRDGRDVDMDAVKQMVAGVVAELPPAAEGLTAADVVPLVAEQVQAVRAEVDAVGAAAREALAGHDKAFDDFVAALAARFDAAALAPESGNG